MLRAAVRPRVFLTDTCKSRTQPGSRDRKGTVFLSADHTMLEKMFSVTDRQFSSNQSKNIFCIEEQLCFREQTVKAVSEWTDVIRSLQQTDLNCLCLNYRRRFLEGFYKVNQYTYFSRHSIRMIDGIYSALLQDLTDTTLTVRDAESRHYARIRAFIKFTNPSIYRINHNKNRTARHFVCSEYSAEFLSDLLEIDPASLKEPVLDIGCGSSANLVRFLRKQGIDAFGIDRDSANDGQSVSDWLEFDFGVNRWGTVISNLSFSSHFLYHHLQSEEIANQYAHTYMKILNSVKTGGTWIYAPAIPFFENLLPSRQYAVERTRIDDNFCKTIITKKQSGSRGQERSAPG